MNEPLSLATARARAKLRMPRRLVAALTALALLTAFEVGVRLIQPDTLVYTATIAQGSIASPTYQHIHLTITNPRAIATWYAAVGARPVENVFSTAFVHCNGLYYLGESYRFEFTWHDLPIETATSNNMTNCGPEMQLTSGGLPGVREYALPYPLPTSVSP